MSTSSTRTCWPVSRYAAPVSLCAAARLHCTRALSLGALDSRLQTAMMSNEQYADQRKVELDGGHGACSVDGARGAVWESNYVFPLH